MISRERLIVLAEKAGLIDHYDLSTPREYFLRNAVDEEEVFKFIDLIVEELNDELWKEYWFHYWWDLGKRSK